MGYNGTVVTCHMEYRGAGNAFDVFWNKAIIKKFFFLLRISLPINYNIIYTALFHTADEGSSSSVSTTILVSVLVPAVLVVILIVAVLFVLGYLSGKASQKRLSARENPTIKTLEDATNSAISPIEDYASIKLPTCNFPDKGSTHPLHLCAPPVPKSPRPSCSDMPTKHNESYNCREDVHQLNVSPTSGEDATYAVLDGPTLKNMNFIDENQYSLDPTYSPTATNPIFFADTIDGEENYGLGTNDATSKPGPLYFELEDIKKSSLMKQRNNGNTSAQTPGSESVASDVYMNEGLGPLKSTVSSLNSAHPPDTSSRVTSPPVSAPTPGSSDRGTSGQSTTEDPTYMELSANNAE